MAIFVADPQARLCSQEDHQCCAHRPGVSADAQEHLPHRCPEKHPPHEAVHSTGTVHGSLQHHGQVQGTQQETGVRRGGGVIHIINILL